MLPIARWSLRLQRQQIRAFATRNSPPGPRNTVRKQAAPSRRPNAVPKPNNEPASQPEASDQPPKEVSKVDAVSNALAQTSDAENNLVTPVYIPEDPNGVLNETHPAMRLLDNSTLVIQRQLEMMNVLMGFEQANRYVIMDPHGTHIGYLAEQEHGMGNAVARQMFKTHRSFTTHVFDREEKEILRFHRPFSWISSRIRIYDAVGKDGGAYGASTALQGTSTGSIVSQTSAGVSSIPSSEMRIIGSAEQEWAPLRRKYNMFLARSLDDAGAALGTAQLTSGDLPLSDSKALQVAEGGPREVGMVQFARVDEPFLSWDFSLMSEDNRLISSVNRNFVGFARELFTDTGVYALRMDAAGLSAGSEDGSKPSLEGHPGMTLDQRAVMLATAVSIDFDYFSRHSGPGGLWPMWLPFGMGGGEAAAGGAAAGEAGAVGAAAGETGIASEAGAAARGVGSSEGWVAGAGTMAGYEAMQRSRESAPGETEVDSQSPQAPDQPPPDQPLGGQSGEDVWDQSNDPGAGGSGSSGGSGGGGGSDGGGGGGGDGGSFFDLFDDWL
ncbi:Scramblase-domain-containing protein [Massariosphaeria phaeospora]|uniref:Scramblase-domain-containing protein n=1 Tax=Massariosphaeria phaeospora TaxID=100035 RepID=A0A7C8I5L0_9PLEO|nr:Scramblase-domain-containing protein [Massariosphaeria phaeospora]